MSGAVSFATAGYVCPPTLAPDRVVQVVGTLVGVIADEGGLVGAIAEQDQGAGLVREAQRLAGQVGVDERLQGVIIIDEGFVGLIRGCPEVQGVTTISFTRGDNADFSFVVLGDRRTLAGTWTWQGTTTVLSTDTSGVIVGEWIRAPQLSSGASGPWFKVTAINANVDVTIENPDELTIPTGVTGAQAASPVDLTGAPVRATARQGKREAWKSTNYTDPDGIEMTNAAAGEGVWHITPHDQVGEKAGVFAWDIETNVPGTVRSSSGTVTVTAGSGILVFSDTAVADAARVGDVFVGTGAGLPTNQTPVVVTSTPDTDDTLEAGQVLTDFTGWLVEPAFSFELRRSDRKTPDGLCGDLVLKDDPTRP